MSSKNMKKDGEEIPRKQAIPDGFSIYDSGLDKYYDEVKSITPPENLFVKHKGKSRGNPYNVELTTAEICVVNLFRSLGHEVILIPEDKMNPRNDFIWDNQEWELKSVVKNSKNSIRNAIWKATSKNKKNIILDLSYRRRRFSKCLCDVWSEVNTFSAEGDICKLLVIRGRKIIVVK